MPPPSLSDAHCHLGMELEVSAIGQLCEGLKTVVNDDMFFSLMATNSFDLAFIEKMIDLSLSVIPYVGIHPWYSHLFCIEPTDKATHYQKILLPPPCENLLSILPDPLPYDQHESAMVRIIGKCRDMKRPVGIGEVGLDKLFRIPSNGFYGNPKYAETVKLTPSKVTMEHQLALFNRQLKLAEDMNLPVSLHCVKAHGAFYDALVNSYLKIPVIILHSYTGSVEQAQAWIRQTAKQQRQLKFLFSNYINVERREHFQLIVALLHESQILMESDMPLDKFLPTQKDDYLGHLNNVAELICSFRGWATDDGIAILRENFVDIHRVT